jgi:hypothetical protein
MHVLSSIVTDNEIIVHLLHFLKLSRTMRIHDEAHAPANKRPASEVSGCSPSPKCHRKAAGAFICQSSFGYLPFDVIGTSGVPSGKNPLSTIDPNRSKVPLLVAKIYMLKIAHTLKPSITRLGTMFAIVLKIVCGIGRELSGD